MTPDDRAILRPFDVRESVPLANASKRAGKSVDTLRRWCRRYGIGRQIAGEWHVSRIALMMFLEGDDAALAAYHAGDRQSERVAQYFRREGILGVMHGMRATPMQQQNTQNAQTPRAAIAHPGERAHFD